MNLAFSCWFNWCILSKRVFQISSYNGKPANMI